MSVEFHCCECRRHIVNIIGDVPPTPPLCALCLAIPGWCEDAKLRKIFLGDYPMNLNHITFTGADDSCRPEELLHLSRHYDFIEWGILVSAKHMGQPRFPSFGWINGLQKAAAGTPVRLSLHICGSLLRDLLVGVNSFHPEMLVGFNRVQLNFHGEALKMDRDAFVKVLTEAFPEREIIFQIDGGMGADFLTAVDTVPHPDFDTAPFFDTSHGAGVLPGSWPARGTLIGNIGYAGGLGPDNLAAQLLLIEAAARGGPYWVDMETKVRAQHDMSDTFDLNAVRRCCDIVHAYRNPPPVTQAEPV